MQLLLGPPYPEGFDAVALSWGLDLRTTAAGMATLQHRRQHYFLGQGQGQVEAHGDAWQVRSQHRCTFFSLVHTGIMES